MRKVGHSAIVYASRNLGQRQQDIALRNTDRQAVLESWMQVNTKVSLVSLSRLTAMYREVRREGN